MNGCILLSISVHIYRGNRGESEAHESTRAHGREHAAGIALPLFGAIIRDRISAGWLWVVARSYQSLPAAQTVSVFSTTALLMLCQQVSRACGIVRTCPATFTCLRNQSSFKSPEENYLDLDQLNVPVLLRAALELSKTQLESCNSLPSFSQSWNTDNTVRMGPSAAVTRLVRQVNAVAPRVVKQSIEPHPGSCNAN